jgi:hypothetical protein
VRQGKTGWVGGGLSWNGLAAVHQQGHRESHLRLLRELYALHQPRGATAQYYYSHREEKTIDLAAFGSRQLWSLLDEADSIGLRLVHARKGLGAIARPGHAELCLDVTDGADGGSLTLAPILRVDGAEEICVPVAFVGAEGHGVVHVVKSQADADPATWTLRLARLNRPVAPPLRRMALAGERLEIPEDQRERFSDEYYPRMRQQATIVSSDGSFSPPSISDFCTPPIPTAMTSMCAGSGPTRSARRGGSPRSGGPSRTRGGVIPLRNAPCSRRSRRP